MISVLISLGFFGMLVFIPAYQLSLVICRMNQAVVLPLAITITAIFMLGVLMLVVEPASVPIHLQP